MTKPRRCCTMIRFGRLRTTRVDSERMTSTRRGSLPTSAARAMARGPGVTVARSTVRPSALETIFWATTSTSRSAQRAVGAGEGGDDQVGKVVAGADHRQVRQGEELQLVRGGHRRPRSCAVMIGAGQIADLRCGQGWRAPALPRRADKRRPVSPDAADCAALIRPTRSRLRGYAKARRSLGRTVSP